MKNDDTTQHWAELEKLEAKARGTFAAGLYLSVDADALTAQDNTGTEVDRKSVEAILDALRVPLVVPRPAGDPEAMKREMSQYFRESAELANLAARGFEALSDEATISIYQEFFALQLKSRKQG